MFVEIATQSAQFFSDSLILSSTFHYLVLYVLGFFIGVWVFKI